MNCQKCKQTANYIPSGFIGQIDFGNGTPDTPVRIQYRHPTGFKTWIEGAMTDAAGDLIVSFDTNLACLLEPSIFFDGCHKFSIFTEAGVPFTVEDENGVQADCVLMDVEIDCDFALDPVTLIFVDDIGCGCSHSCDCLSCQSNG